MDSFSSRSSPDYLIDWKLDVVDNGIESVQTYGSRTPQYFQARLPEAEMTLYRITVPEAQEVLALINKLRSTSLRVPEPAAKPLALSRFAGLEI